jgi:hypothetical protein
MTDEITQAVVPSKKPTAKKPVTVKPAKKTRAPRRIDPEAEAIRAECKAKIEALAGDRASNKILQTIIARRLPKLTQEHKLLLYDELAKTITPPLFKQLESNQTTQAEERFNEKNTHNS